MAPRLVLRARRALLCAAVLAAGGCTRWQHVPQGPSPQGEPGTVRAARVTPSSTGRMIVLRNVEITADSVIGWRQADGFERRGERVALHHGQVLVFERAVTDPWATAGASAFTVVTAYALIALYFAAQSY